MFSFVVATIRGGVRMRSVQSIVLITSLLLLGSWMAGEFSARAPATVTLDIGITLTRFALVILALLWTQEFFAKDIERRVIFTLLTQPVPRHAYLYGRFLGVAALLAATLAIIAISLSLLVTVEASGYAGQRPPSLGGAYLLTLVCIYLDALVILAFAWLLTAISTTPFLPFSLGLIFAWAVHSLGPALNYLAGGSSEAERLAPTFMPLLEFVRWVVPDLSRLDVRHLSLYGLDWQWSEIFTPMAMGLGYLLLSLGIAAWIINRREFD